jgi:mRNA-degrading endonuclease RelE of RelBE toxin-antitoxin system
MMKKPIEVVPSHPFLKRIKKLRETYPDIQDDVQPLINRLIEGETPGDQIQGLNYIVYKARVSNRDTQRGKSGDYRIIYYIYTTSKIILLTIYSKTERTDITAEEIKAIIDSLPLE